MNIENVVDIFTRLSSLTANDIVKFRFMCEDAMEYVNSHIKKNVDTSVYSSRLCTATATLAYYRFVLWRVSDGMGEELKLGEVSIKPYSQKQIEAVEKLCNKAFEAIGEIMTDDCFIFRRI